MRAPLDAHLLAVFGSAGFIGPPVSITPVLVRTRQVMEDTIRYAVRGMKAALEGLLARAASDSAASQWEGISPQPPPPPRGWVRSPIDIRGGERPLSSELNELLELLHLHSPGADLPQQPAATSHMPAVEDKSTSTSTSTLPGSLIHAASSLRPSAGAAREGAGEQVARSAFSTAREAAGRSLSLGSGGDRGGRGDGAGGAVPAGLQPTLCGGSASAALAAARRAAALSGGARAAVSGCYQGRLHAGTD